MAEPASSLSPPRLATPFKPVRCDSGVGDWHLGHVVLFDPVRSRPAAPAIVAGEVSADIFLCPGLADLAQAVTGEVGPGWVAVDGHDQISLGEDRPEDVHHAVVAAEGKTPGVGAADPDGSGAERARRLPGRGRAAVPRAPHRRRGTGGDR
jgi:hypothetical protein